MGGGLAICFLGFVFSFSFEKNGGETSQSERGGVKIYALCDFSCSFNFF